MSPEEALEKYNEEWEPLGKEFEVLKLAGDRMVIKAMRQRLTALSIKYELRHEIGKLDDYLDGDYPTQEELIHEIRSS